MKKYKKLQSNGVNLIIIIVLLGIIFFSVNYLLKPKSIPSDKPVVKIGAGDDISGLVLSFMQSELIDELDFKLEPYFIRDC